MNRKFLLYLSALKYLGTLAAVLYAYQGHVARALQMHELVLCIIALKWATLIYNFLRGKSRTD